MAGGNIEAAEGVYQILKKKSQIMPNFNNVNK